MKWLLGGLLLLFTSIVVALFALPDPGYVLIGYGKHSVETSLLALLFLLAGIYLAIRILARTFGVPLRLRRWGQQWQRKRIGQLYDQAVIELAEGQFEQAERHMARLAQAGNAPLALLFSAARTASQLNANDRCNRYLKLARQAHPQAERAIGFLEAEMQLANNQLEQAQSTLTHLYSLAPRNPKLLNLLIRLYTRQNNWGALRKLLPELERSKILEHGQWQQLALKVWRQQSQLTGLDDSHESLQKSWHDLPSFIKDDDVVLTLYVEQLIQAEEYESAEKLIADRLDNHWNTRLAWLYGELKVQDAGHQQQLAEHWLQRHPQEPVLLLTLGKISLRNQLWGKARSYLEASVARQPAAETYQLLGALLEQLDEIALATDCYRKGIEFVVHDAVQS